MSSLKYRKKADGTWHTVANGAGVVTFNGRAGMVVPMSADYTAEMVGADAAGSADAALDAAKTYTNEQIANIPAPDVSGQINAHNNDQEAHPDIRDNIIQLVATEKVAELPNPYATWEGYSTGDCAFIGTYTHPYGDRLLYSVDGIHWDALNAFPSYIQVGAITSGNGRIVVTPYNGSTGAYSNDGGKTWVTMTMPNASFWNVASFGNGRFVAACRSSYHFAYSDDGINWVAANNTLSFPPRHIVYGNNKFVAISANSTTSTKAAYSDDGITWTETIKSDAYGYCLTYGNGRFVAPGNSVSGYSDDGITWTDVTMPEISGVGGIENVKYGNGRFVGIQFTGGNAIYSDDGITWNVVSVGEDKRYADILYCNNQFIAIPYQHTSLNFSSDGLTWSEKYSGIAAISSKGEDVTEELIALLGINTMRAITPSANRIESKLSKAGGTMTGTTQIKCDITDAGDFIRCGKIVATAEDPTLNGHINWTYG